MNDSASSLYTSGRYEAQNPDWHEEDAEHKAKVLFDVCRYLGLHPRTVADVGCGTGRVLWHFKKLRDASGETACLYEGWDIASRAVKRARGLETGRLKYVGEDFLASEREVDLILCVDTFEHVADDVGFLRGLRERARFFLFRIPLDLSVLDAARPRRLLAARAQWGHRHAYNRVLALQVLQEAGYRVDHERYDRVPPALSRPRQHVMDGVRRALFRASPHQAVRLLGGWSLIVFATPDTLSSRA